MVTRLTIFWFLLSGTALAQTNLRGRVTDAQGNPIPGANILLRGTYDGSSTDNNGAFVFVSSEKGPQILVISAISFKPEEQPVELSGKEVFVSAVLKEAVTELNAVVITAGSFTAGDEDRRTTFKSLDIASTAGATADIAGALNTLPGTQKVGETGRLFVRGGDDNETRTFIDGMVVLDAYSPSAPNTPSRGRFLPFMFKGTSFSTGGYSAEYGQALSSALALDSKDEDETTRTDVGLLSVGADVAHTQAWTKGSAAAKVQYTNLRPYMGLINQQVDWITPPLSTEVSGAVRQRFGDKGLLKFYGNANEANFSLYQHAIADPTGKLPLEVTNRYRYGNLSYQVVLPRDWSVRTGVSYNTSAYDNTLATLAQRERGTALHVKAAFEKTTSSVVIRTGGELIDRDYRSAWTDEQQGTLTQSFHEPITAAFGEADITFSKNFVARAGVRGEYNGLTHNAALDPRLSLARKLGQGQLSLAYGRFRQSPQTQWLRANNQLHAEKAEHWMLSYQLITNSRTFRAEVYYKRYDDLVRFTVPGTLPSAFQPLNIAMDNSGNGYARGAELFWRDNRTFRNVDYWISYSYLDTRREYLYYPTAAVPSFASAHNFSVVYKHFVPKLKTQFGVTWSLASARPYHDPNRPGFLQGRTPNYSDLSANVSYLPTSWMIVHFSCTNLLGYDNIFGYTYATTPDAQGVYAGRAIRQPATRFLFLGIFITLSKNKGINQLPSL
ncbi:MAG: TonB-dependent receptor [Cyclobacteriaceae bacterium]|nr:TonB-dependent receptor [Cyclobacteriaceae bacterium]